jgi:4-amino-4-deoxy-L-arabinose transferase-like glycosyltransferase
VPDRRDATIDAAEAGSAQQAAEPEPETVGRAATARNTSLRRRRLVVTGLIALTFYGYAWFIQPNRPQLGAVFDDPPRLVNITERGILPSEAQSPLAIYQQGHWGWIGAWYDQFHYAREARALARFQIPGQYWDRAHQVPSADAPKHGEVASFNFGLGYPAVGAVFAWLGFRGDPFVVPDALLFALSAMLALTLAERVLRPLTALIVVNVLVLTGPFVLYFVIPYSTSLTIVAMLASLLALTGTRFTWPIGIAVGIAVSLAFAARYSEIMWMSLLLVPLLWRWRETWRVLVAVATSLGITAILLGAAQQIAFGSPFDTPYTFSHNGVDASTKGYALARIPRDFVGVFITGKRQLLFGVGPILRSFPWAVLAPVGLFLLVRSGHRLRWHFTLAAIAGVASTLFFSSYYAGGPNDLILWTIRYHISWFPLWAVLAGVAIERGLAAVTGDTAVAARDLGG